MAQTVWMANRDFEDNKDQLVEKGTKETLETTVQMACSVSTGHEVIEEAREIKGMLAQLAQTELMAQLVTLERQEKMVTQVLVETKGTLGTGGIQEPMVSRESLVPRVSKVLKVQPVLMEQMVQKALLVI